jgi:hypothetical protein
MNRVIFRGDWIMAYSAGYSTATAAAAAAGYVLTHELL